MLRFRGIRRIRWIRRRIPGGPKIEYSTAILAHLLGKWGPILGSTLEKPKEKQGFWLQPSKNLRKIKVLRLWEPLGDPKGVRAGPGTPRDPPSNLFGPNRAAIWSFLAFLTPYCAEFRRGSRQGGSRPLNLNVFSYPQNALFCQKGPLGPPGGWDFQALLLRGGVASQGRFFPAKNRPFPKKHAQNGQNKVEIEGVGPPWRDPRRNSA